MASTKLKRRDINRFRKVYPYLRRRPVYSFVSNEEFVVEVGKLSFSNSSSETYTFAETYNSAPTVTAIAVDSEDSGAANVNVFITSLSTTSVTLESSDAFTGQVHFQIIKVGS